MSKLTHDSSKDQWFVGEHALHVGDLILAKHPRNPEVSRRIWMIDRDVEATWHLSSNGSPLDNVMEMKILDLSKLRNQPACYYLEDGRWIGPFYIEESDLRTIRLSSRSNTNQGHETYLLAKTEIVGISLDPHAKIQHDGRMLFETLKENILRLNLS